MTDRDKPHIQNIPPRTDIGRALREVFVLSQLHSWGVVDVDYVELERRALKQQEGEEP